MFQQNIQPSWKVRWGVELSKFSPDCYLWWMWALVSPDGVAPGRMVGVSLSVSLPLHHKAQKFSSGTDSPGWSLKKGRKTVVYVCVCVTYLQFYV